MQKKINEQNNSPTYADKKSFYRSSLRTAALSDKLGERKRLSRLQDSRFRFLCTKHRERFTGLEFLYSRKKKIDGEKKKNIVGE